MDFDIDHGFGLEGGADGPQPSGPDLVWRDFARAAGVHEDQPAPRAIAAALNRRPETLPPGAFYDQLTELVTSAAGNEPGDNAARMSELVHALEPAVMAGAIEAGRNILHRKWLLQSLARVVEVDAVIPLVRVSAQAYGRPLSETMTSLLAKSERLALGSQQQAAAAVAQHRTLAAEIVEAWSSDSVDTTGTGYDSLFDAPGEPAASAPGGVAPDAERVIALSFETGALGGAVWNALAQLGRNDHGARRILDMLADAPDTKAAEMVAQQVATPARLTTLLREETLDLDAIDALLARMGEAAAGALLDALFDARTSKARSALLQRVATLGASICPVAIERLSQETRPTALRDLLAVVREAGCDRKDVPLDKFIRHEDVRVRREATRLLFEDPIARERAVIAALRDEDVGMLKVGIKAALDALPAAAVPLLAKRVTDPKFPPEYRTSVLHLLSQSQSVLALDVLLGYAVGGKTLLGKPMLAPKSPEMLIALSGLARVWPNERRVVDVVERARKTGDPEIEAALTASGPPGGLLLDLDDADDD